MEEPAIRCTPQGEMTAQPDVLDMLSSDFECYLLSIKDSMMKCRAIIERAKMYRLNNDEHAALHYCLKAMDIARSRSFLHDYGKEGIDMFREVDSLLYSLSSSDDEYVWEVASQVRADILDSNERD